MDTIIQLLGGLLGKVWITISFPIYILYILWRNNWKILHSISDSWYVLKEHETHEEILFTIFTYLLGIGILLQYYESPLFFIGGMGFFWVGTQTQFRGESIKGTIHYIGAVLGIVLSLVGLSLNGIYLPLIIMGIGVGIMKWKKINNFIFWAEILAFLTTIGGLWIL
jgi:hypothetical protein